MELSQDRFEEALTAFCDAYRLEISKAATPLFYRYLHWLQKFDFLTGKLSFSELFSDLLCDSLLALPLLKRGEAILDFGTGGGIPGLPLAMAYPEAHFLLLDSQKRKVDALKRFLQNEALSHVELCCARAEEHLRKKRESYDAVLVKGIRLSHALEIGFPLLKRGGMLLHWEREEFPLKEAKAHIVALGGELTQTKRAVLPSGKRVQLALFQKVAETPSRAPRPFPKMKKKPLF